MLTPNQKAQIAKDIEALALQKDRPEHPPLKSGDKRCSTCRQWLSVTSFDRNKRARDGLNNVCIPCRRQYYKEWYQKRKQDDDTAFLAKSAASLRRSVLNWTLTKYKLTQEQYDVLAAKGCGICGDPPTGRGRYHFDHNPTTGKFRGLLCSKCNPALGLFQESLDLLVRAAGYLAEHQPIQSWE